METSSFLRPGNYIGFVIRPSAGPNLAGYPRLPVIVGKGSRLAQYLNSEIIRAKVSDETLTFTGTGPYTAVLDFQSDGNKSNTQIVDSDGVELDGSKYSFTQTVVANDSVIVATRYFNTTTTYYITYQSIDRDVLDPLPYDDIRSIISMGRGPGGKDFTEYLDYILPVTVTDGVPDAGNTYLTGQAYGSGGDYALGTVLGANNEDITVTALTEGPAGNGIKIVTVIGLALSVVEDVPTKVITITYITAASTTTAIVAASSALTLAEFTGVGVTVWGAPEDAQEHWTTSMTVDGGNTGDGILYFASTSTYTHPYNRTYSIECTTGGAGGAAIFAWSSTPVALGNDMAHHNPTHTTYVLTAGVVNQITPVEGAVVSLEYGLKFSVQDQGGTFDVGDVWTYTAYGVGVVERSVLHENTNQFTTIGSVVPDPANTGTGVVTIHSLASEFTGDWNRSYKLTTVAITGTTNVTLAWTAIGDDGIATGTTAVLIDSATADLDEGVEIAVDLGATNFVVGDSFTVTIAAPRVVPDVKDNRSYEAEVSVAGAGSVAFIFSSGTPEGGTGTFTAITADQSITFDGSLTMMVRNVSTPRFRAGDIFTWTTTLADVIDWSVQIQETETVSEDDIILDSLGVITGTAGHYYIILNHTPDTLVSVVNSVPTPITGAAIVVDVGGDNTRFIDLGAADPADDLTVVYQHKGAEPTPGDSYRLSAQYLRGTDLYNVPIFVRSKDEGETLLFPMGTTNHLAIINSLAWKLNPDGNGFFVCQVADADEDGIYQDSDYDTAIEACFEDTRITDMVVLSAFGTLGTQLQQIDELADPLQKNLRMLWVGMPLNTEVGDSVTPNTLAYTAINTLAVFGDNQSHGTRVMVGPTECTYTITLADGKTTVVTLDGSFVAAVLCMQYAGFAEPWMTSLRTLLTVFDSVQTFTEAENKVLGSARINFLDSVGTGVYRWVTEMTTDSMTEWASPNLRIQDKYVTRAVDGVIESQIISLTPEDPLAGAEALRNVVVGTLSELVSTHKIGRYLSDAGTPRKIISGSDVRVYRDTTSPNIFRYVYGYYRRHTITHTFGLAVVDSNNFGIVEP